MNKLIGAVTGVLFLTCSPALAEDWANRMFAIHQHDFGTIARGAKAEYEFTFKNLYVEDVHVASVRPSCGCASVRMKDDRLLKTFETGAIVANINSGSFLGNRGATITVTFDKPFFAEAQLQVKVLIRSDVVLEPGSVQFGSVDQGTAAERNVKITCPGGNNLRILGVKSTNPHVVAKLLDTGRGWADASYQLQVRLSNDAPAGYIADQLTLMTSDPQSPHMPVLVEGRVLPSLVISPNWLFMGVVQPGQKVNKQMVVQGKEPFLIKKIMSEGGDLQFELPAQTEPKRLHVIPVTFLASDKPGKVTRTIRIETNQPGMVGELSAQAVVAGPEGVLVQHTEPVAPAPQASQQAQSRQGAQDREKATAAGGSPNPPEKPREPRPLLGRVFLGHR
jgi:hypothetical protein